MLLPAFTLTLFTKRGFLCLLRFALGLVTDLAGDRTGHIELVDIQCGLAERCDG